MAGTYRLSSNNTLLSAEVSFQKISIQFTKKEAYNATFVQGYVRDFDAKEQRGYKVSAGTAGPLFDTFNADLHAPCTEEKKAHQRPLSS